MVRTRVRAGLPALAVVLLGSLLSVAHQVPAQAVEDGASRAWWGTITITGARNSHDDTLGSETISESFSATLTRSRDGAYSGRAQWQNRYDSVVGECYVHDQGFGEVTFPEHTNLTDAPMTYDAGAAAWVKEFPEIWVPTLQTRDANCGNESGQHYFDYLIGHPRCPDPSWEGWSGCWPSSLNLTVTDAAIAGRPEPRIVETRTAVPVSDASDRFDITISYDVSWAVDGPDAADEPLDETACAPPAPGSGVKKKYHYTTADGKARWVIAAGPDAKIATFDVGIRWCTTPDGPAFRGPARLGSQVVAHWLLLGALENAGFVVEVEEPSQKMTGTKLTAKGRVVGAFSPVEVALNLLPVTRILHKVTGHVDDCYRKVAGGVDPARALPEMVDKLAGPVKKLKKAIRKQLQKQLDKRMTTVLAIKLSHRWLRGLDHVGAFLVDDLAKRVALGEVAVKGAAKLVGESFRLAFGKLRFTIWRPHVVVDIKKNGKHTFTDKSSSPIYLPIDDEWKHKTVP
ncbi:hypothetical protein [Nocardioides sp. LHG3406-4]|uniref:hypothetical protein n=1 Tax=Nocardioides sp. LHG3406-4 TaxID=2804575 RepID=UPI003CEDA52D